MITQIRLHVIETARSLIVFQTCYVLFVVVSGVNCEILNKRLTPSRARADYLQLPLQIIHVRNQRFLSLVV